SLSDIMRRVVSGITAISRPTHKRISLTRRATHQNPWLSVIQEMSDCSADKICGALVAAQLCLHCPGVGSSRLLHELCIQRRERDATTQRFVVGIGHVTIEGPEELS